MRGQTQQLASSMDRVLFSSLPGTKKISNIRKLRTTDNNIYLSTIQIHVKPTVPNDGWMGVQTSTRKR
jgi:hypothetical protein